ncbi:MAG: tol-pal system protein YbgF [Rhodospirillales bacterium]
MTYPRATPLAVVRTAAAFLLAATLAGPAAAQSSDVYELINRVDRLQRELSTLQRQVYRGDVPPPPSAAPAATGRPTTITPSDQNAMSRLDVRLGQLEAELRSLTGRVEELSYAQRQHAERVDKALQDAEFRLGRLEQGAPAAAATEEPPQRLTGQPPRQSAAVTPPPSSAAPAANPGLGAPPRDLGSVPADRVTSPAPSASPPPRAAGTPQEQYDYAMALLTRDQNLPEAEKALRSFVEAHPESPQVSNAQYWLGETFFARKDYQQAAAAFAEGYKKYPKSAKAPDTLLKLGMSLAQLNRRKDACAAYTRLLDNHPTASAALKGRAQREQKSLNCSA